MPDTDHRILTVAETTAADAVAVAAGVPLELLMQRAGQAVAAAIIARWVPRPVLVLCGPGNNGGDGYEAASELARQGWTVRVAASGDVSRLRGAAATAAKGWSGPVVRMEPAALDGIELVIDALFGAGLSRALGAADRDMLRRAAERAPLVAVDLPSGLAGDTGAVLGYAPTAAVTVTFHRKKPAHVLEPGRSLCGEVVVADIGLAPPDRVGGGLFENHPGLWRAAFPRPSKAAHKGDRGRLVLVAGPMHSTGACRLAARAAHWPCWMGWDVAYACYPPRPMRNGAWPCRWPASRRAAPRSKSTRRSTPRRSASPRGLVRADWGGEGGRNALGRSWGGTSQRQGTPVERRRPSSAPLLTPPFHTSALSPGRETRAP